MKEYFQITITTQTEEEKDILIAKLILLGFEAFEEEGQNLKAFIEVAEFQEQEFQDVIKDQELNYSIQKLPVTNWNSEWEKNITAVNFDDFCTVRAEFNPTNPNTKFDIVITPKMSFGTGHHATTYVMIQSMQGMDFRNKRVLDFGTGTGILAILSEKLGASKVVAVDNNEWSIENAKENLTLNGSQKVKLVKSDNIRLEGTFDIILANLNRNTLLENLQVVADHLDTNGILLLSGLLRDDFEPIKQEAGKWNFHLQDKVEKDGWITLKYVIM